MKRNSYSAQKALLWVIGVLAVILAAVLVRKGFELYKERVHQEKLDVRNKEVQSELDDMQMQIKKLSGDGEALQNFLNEKISIINSEAQSDMVPAETEVQEVISSSVETDRGQAESQTIGEESRPEDNAIIIDIPEKARPQNNNAESVSANSAGKKASEETISGNGREAESGETISGNGVSQNSAQETISGNAVVDGQLIPFRNGETTLEEKRNVRSSYAETTQINGFDKAQIANGTIDFSDMKIACLGDSLTAGSNMSELDDYQKYSYPSVLKEMLNAEEVYNLGVGGSSYGRYWDKAFVDRYGEIPEDSDIILVMGGTNDGFAASAEELGSIDERKRRTFYGDVDELMRGLKKDYPSSKIIFATPLPNILHDYLMTQREYLLPQSVFADAIKALAAEYDIDVIDLYNSNILDTHDSQIISAYMPDGVHGNPGGYQILAEHFASGLIRIMESDALYEETVSGNTSSGESISGNISFEETVSGNMGETEEQKEKEELKKIEEGNKRAADSAVIVAPTKTEEETTDHTEGGDVEEELTETQNNYEYGGEAIVIQ